MSIDMRVLITCPPMLNAIEDFSPLFERKGIEVATPHVVQTIPEEELIKLVPGYDGWIIGDDPATRRVFEAATQGRLKAAVKWGVGVDNVDFDACREFGVQISNTPNMFGPEVADMAVGYVIALARETFRTDRGVRDGDWPKIRGISLSGKVVGLVGHGDIGRNVARRLLSAETRIIGYDPGFSEADNYEGVVFKRWPEDLGACDFLVFTCALTDSNKHMLNAEAIAECKQGVRIVNVARGPLIDESALIAGLRSRKVYSAALDVFEVEPLLEDSELRNFPECVFGAHNASNTVEAVQKTNVRAVELLLEFLGVA